MDPFEAIGLAEHVYASLDGIGMCGQSELDLRQEGRLDDEFGGHGR